MPLSPDTPWFGVNDAQLAVVTADPDGGTTTYGTLMDVPGIKSVTWGGDISSNELRGDGTRLDFNAAFGGWTLGFEFGKSALAVFSALLGGTVVNAGATPAQSATWTHTKTSRPNYFKFESQTLGTGNIGGDGHIIGFKCVLTSVPELGHVEEDYKTYTVEAAAMPRQSDGNDLSVVYNETLKAIA